MQNNLRLKILSESVSKQLRSPSRQKPPAQHLESEPTAVINLVTAISATAERRGFFFFISMYSAGSGQ